MIKRIVLQAGHSNSTTSSGAPNEMSFNVDIRNTVAGELRKRGFEVATTDANGDKDPAITGTDWDLFLAIHYDADIYGTGGGFVDFPEPSTDRATVESQRIAYLLRQEYFGTTHIVNHPERSNKNTRYYYMWKALSAKTPCVIIECGVGMHVPDDHQILHFNRPLVVEGIVKGICLAFNVPYTITEPPQTPPNQPGSVPTPETTPTTTDEKTVLINKLREIVYSRWTWAGLTNSWKVRLSQLKELLP